MWVGRAVPPAVDLGPMDGTCVHSCTPRFGKRVWLVLFTHECVLRPLPASLYSVAAALGVASESAVSWEQFSELGLLALAREADWRLTAALSEVAEAVLHVAQLPCDDLHRALCIGDDAAPCHAGHRAGAQGIAHVPLTCLPHRRRGARVWP